MKAKEHHHPEAEAEVKNPAPETEPAAGSPAPEAEKTAEPTAEEKLAAALEKYLYLQAEYQNYRKRAAKEISDARVVAQEDTLVPFLSVYDFLTMAQSAAQKSDNIESLRQGVDMIIAQFFKAFEDLGVKPFDATGEVFDPNRHEAVGKESSDTVPAGTVIKAWNCGFTLGSRLLRPARVVVSTGKAAEPAPESDKE